ncbi:hypothetical protein LCGC14_1038890 [marine sediment metagenome]|uniref:Uncharacterized protein n=1 Tax=marine sediment metagenome TaxID=412755 RepID=A0A0F9NDZ8_9ZZZZ
MPNTKVALVEAFEVEAKELRRKIKRLLNGSLSKAAVGLPPTFPAYVELSVNEYGSLFVFVPNDPEKLNYVRDRFKKFGWEVEDFVSSDWGSYRTEAKLLDENPEHSWEKTRNSASIIAMDSKEGATCRTVRIGTALKEVSVYETRCTEDGADALDSN